MSPDEVRQARRRLRLTARALGEVLGVDGKTVMAWERGDAFPTKRYCDAIARTEREATAKQPKEREPAPSSASLAALQQPRLWALVAKLCAHPELLDAAEELAEDYELPE